MAEYVVTGPDGKEYEVTAPEGATEAQIIRQVQSYIDSTSMPEPTREEPGFWGGLGNAVARFGGRVGTMYDNYMAEQLAQAADAEAEMQRRRESGEMSTLDRILTARAPDRMPGGANYESPEDLRSQAAGYIASGAQRTQDFAERFPMTRAGGQAISDLSQVESIGEGLSIIADRPLDVLSGVAQVGAEQIPTLGAAMAGTALTRNPNVGVGIMYASTLGQERFGQMQEVAQEMGYDISDPAQARAAIADEAFLDAQAERGFDRGLVIATIDALTLKAGSALLPNNLRGLAGNTVLQMGSGAGGEALAQQVTLGEVAKPGEVLVEGLAEGPFAAAEVLGVMRNGGNSETRVDTPDPQAAAEEAILAQQAEQEQADNERAVRQSRVQAELDLMPFKDFQRLRNEDLTNRILDPNTEEGTDFRAWLAETRDENNPVPRTEADLRKAIGAYIKDAVPPVSFDEFNSVLDEHAAYRAEAAQRTPEAAAQAEQLRAELIAERAAARESGDAAAIAAVEAKAAEFFQPGEWRYYTLQADNRLPAAPKKGGLGANFTVQTTAPTQPTAPAQRDNAGLSANTSTDQPVNMVEPDAAAAPTAGEAPAVDTTPTPPVEAQTDAPTLADAPADAQSPELEATTDEAVNSVSPAQPTAGEAGTAPEADTTPPAKPEAPRTIEMRGFAQEQLGENWEVDFPDIQARFENRTGFYKKNANGEFAFQAAVRKAAEERAAEQQTEEAAFTPQNDEQRVNAEYAVRELGENWTQDEELTQILQDGKYGLFKREVDARAQEAETDRLERGGAGNAAAAFTNDPAFRKTLSGQEQRLYDELVDAFTNNRVDDVMSVDGGFNSTAIAERLGFKGKQNVATALTRIRKKMADFQGITEEQLAQRMAESATVNRQTEAADEADATLAEQLGVARVTDGKTERFILPDGMAEVSAGGAQTNDSAATAKKMTDRAKKLRAREIKEFKAAGMTDEQIEAFYAKQDEPENTDEVYQQKVEERRTATQQQEDALIEQNLEALESMWNARRSEDGPDFADLSQENKRSWLGSVREWAETNNDEQFDTDQRELEKITTKGAANGQAEQTNAGPVESGASVQQQRTADPQGQTGSGGQVDAAAAQADSAGGTADAKGQVTYTTGSPVSVNVYHGSNSDIVDFDAARLGENTGSGSAREAFFFSGKPQTASSYAENQSDAAKTENFDRSLRVMKKYLTGGEITGRDKQHLDVMLEQAKETPNAMALLNDVKEKAANADPESTEVAQYARSLARQLQPQPRPTVQMRRVSLQNPYVYDFKGSKFRDQTYVDIIKTAKENGHDGAILMNTYDVAGKTADQLTEADQDTIFAVFDTESISNTFGPGQMYVDGKPISADSKPVVTVRKKRRPKKFSKRNRGGGTPITVDELQQVAQEKYGATRYELDDGTEVATFPGGIYSRIQIHATPKEALRARGGKTGTMTMEDLKDAQAFIDPADPNVAHFIASNMDKETAAGVLDHEVGVHLGVEAQMDPIILGELTNAVKDWSNLDEGTVENEIYRAAMGRVAYARATGMEASLSDIEFLAYAVEEAVNAGVKPDANAESGAARWLADIQEFFSNLLQRFINKGVLREMDPGAAQTTPIISAEELVALAQAAARVSTQDIVVEHGAHEDAKPDQVMGYYAAQDRGRPLADDASLEDTEYPGMEKFHWGKNSAFGPYNDITTDMTEGFGDGLFIDVNSSSVPDAWLTRLSLSPVAPNVYSVTVYGPMDDAVQGVSETKDVENEYWSRLEGVTHAQNIKLMTEARRRLTRYNGGIVPNLVWTRVTGAAAKNNTEDGRSGSLFYEDARKRFSKRDPGQKPQGEISIRNRAGRNWVKKNLGDATAQAYDSLASFVTDPIEKAQFLYDLVEGVQEKMPSLKNVYKALTKQEAVRNELIMEAESIAQRAAALKPERYAALNDFIGKSTFYQKWGYDPTQTHAELFKGRKIKVDPVMKAAWNRLTDVEQGIAADVFAQGEKRRVRMQEFMKKLGMKNNLFTAVSNLQGPYAPLKRFGNYVAVLKSEEVRNLERQIKDPKQATPRLKKKLDELKSSADHYVVQFFDTEGAANRFAEQNNVSNGGKYFRTEAFERTEQGDSDRAPSTQLLEELLGKLKADDKSGIDDASKEAFRTMLREHYFSMMDERDARTSGARRLNRAGYDTDMIKSFMFHSNAQAQMIASMEEGANINEALAQARREAGEDRGNLMSAYNVVAQHYANNMQRRGGFFDALNDKVTAFNTYHMLTTNVGYAVQNFTQIIVAANKLFGDFGDYSGAWTQLFKGLIAANKSLEGGGFLRQLGSVASAGIIDTKNNIEINLDSFSDEHKAVVRELQLHQLADVGIQEDLRQFTSFDTGFAPTNAIVDFGAKVAHRVYQAARYVEAHLRVATGIAAYEMAKQNPKVLRTLKVDSPIAYAVSSVQRTQGAFNGLDAPLYFKQLPKVVTQYRKYQLMMMSFYARSMNQAFLNESPEVREIGRRTLAVTMAHAAVTTGAVGSAFFMPLISPVISLIMAAFGGDDEEAIAAKAESAGGYDKYMEQVIREKVEDEDLANLLTRGVPAFFGLDMSGKIGHQNTFTLTPFSDFEFTRDGIASYAGDLLLGPTMGTLRNFGAANEARLRGDEMTALKYVLPRGQRQMLESFDLANNGMRFSNQELLLDPRNIDIRSLALNALGLPPTEITTLKWTRSQQFEIRNYFDTRSSRLRDQYAEARRNNDRAAMSELREEWRELQRAKDRVRPFFNNQRGVLDRQPVTDLIRSSRTRERQAERNRRTLGTE